MKSGNTELVQYGIHEEEVDLRMHVGFEVGILYVYEREKAIEILHHHPVRSAYQVVNGQQVETARGYIIPVDWSLFSIYGLMSIEIPSRILEKYKCRGQDDESLKGKRALGVVQDMLQEGRIQLYMPKHFKITAKPENDLEMQIKGRDILYVPDFPSMQVKCDYRAGDRAKGGTGNLYIQTHECNPHGKH